MSSIKFVGIDEVGRGSLFGPVFAGAIILNKEAEILLIKQGLKDSKKLTPKKRNVLVPLIKANSTEWALGQSSAREIDLIGIRQATEKAMLRAIDRLIIKPDVLLIDGALPLKLWEGDQRNFVKGEDKFPSIAAASVLAKVSRDALIKRLAKEYPLYGLEKNMGYGTKFHCSQIKAIGPTKLHRKTFITNII